MIRQLYMLSFCLTLALPALASTAPSAADEQNGDGVTFDFGPIASRIKDVNGNWRLKILGPLYELEHAAKEEGKRVTAYRPFYSTVDDPENAKKGKDYLWPLASTRSIHDEGRWRWLFFYGFDHNYEEPDHRYRFWLLPFYFQSRAEDGTVNRALFPLGGTIADFIGRDTITFVLWPLFQKTKLNDVSTINVLWPLISRTTTEDDRLYRARFFPFYGVTKRAGKYDKRFVLWPFYTSVKYHYKNSPGGGHILFPLYGYLNISTEKTFWLFPPFFRYTKGDERNIIRAPWPFYQRVTGDNVYKHYIWPLWGHRVTGDRERNFYLWPFFWTDHDKRPGSTSKRFIFAPFFSHTSVRGDLPLSADQTKGPVLERRHKFWPIYSYRREGDQSRFRFLELWPFAEASAVERNLAPFWSLFTRDTSGDEVNTEVLWGLYRHYRTAENDRYWSAFPFFDYKSSPEREQSARKWNFLKGLIGYERKGSEKKLRLLYFIKLGLGNGEDE